MNNEKKEKPSQNRELFDELEQMISLVEKTLKEETEKADNFCCEDVLIQSLEDVEPDVEKKADEKKKTKECSFCGEELSVSAFSDDRDYCDDCREKMRKRPVKAKGFITLLVMAVVFFGSMFTSMSSVMDFSDLDSTEYEAFFEGYIAYGEKKLISCVSYYNQYLDERQSYDNVSEKAVRQLIDAYCKMGEYPHAVQIIEEYYSDFQLKLPWNIKYRNIIEKNEAYSGAYNDIMEILRANASSEGYDYEKIASDILKLKGEKEGYADFLIDIFAFDFTVPVEKDTEVLYNMLLEIDSRYGNEEYDHLPILCRYAALSGDKEVVDDCYNRMMKVNCQNMSIYSSYFNYYRYLENPDVDKMLEICRTMADVSGQLMDSGYYNFDYMYYYAIAYMLQGGAGEMPFTLMQELYNAINYYGSYYSGNAKATDIFNLYALTALYTGNTEQYEWAKAEMEYLGYEISGIVEKYAKGEITLREVIADKGGDIA